MQGAREFAGLFPARQQHGRLYLVPGGHARGKTFHIWVFPSDAPLIVPGMPPWSVKDAVEVYGITSGQPGWTESYGWLHRGPWEQDFAALVERRRAEVVEAEARRQADIEAAEADKKSRIAALLAAYPNGPSTGQ